MPAITFPPVGAASDVMIGKMYINYGNYGWTEKFVMGNQGTTTGALPTYGNAVTLLVAGCIYRAYLLGAGAQIVWASVSLGSVTGDSVGALAGPQGALMLSTETTVEAINEPNDALMIRLEDGLGKHSQRLIRGVRDSWITGNLLTPAAFLVGAPNTNVVSLSQAGPLAAAPTANGAILNWLSWLQMATVMARKVAAPGAGYTYYPNTNIWFRNVSTRQTGRPFGMRRGRAAMKV